MIIGPLFVREEWFLPAGGSCQLMDVRLHPPARKRMTERGTTEAEVISTVESGERFPAKFGRKGFRRNFVFWQDWLGRRYATKQVEAYAVEEENGWLVVTVLVKYF